MPLAKISDKALTIYLSDPPIHGPPCEKARSPRRSQSHRDAGATITTARQNQKSP
jgi:hypothetical protein